MKARASFLTLLALGLFALGCGRSSNPTGKVEKPSWFTNPDPTSSQASPDLLQRQVENLNTKIATYNESRVLNKRLLDECNKEKEALVAQLKKDGVKSGVEVTDPRAKRNLNKLVTLVTEQQRFQKIDDHFDDAIGQAKTLIRRLESVRVLSKAGVTEKELTDVDIQLRKLDAKLDATAAAEPTAPLRAEEILKKELGD
jgi:hypothetical protein